MTDAKKYFYPIRPENNLYKKILWFLFGMAIAVLVSIAGGEI